MSTKTTNLNLDKPELTDAVSKTIPQLASNFDLIDTSLAEKANQTDLNATNTNVTNNTNQITNKVNYQKVYLTEQGLTDNAGFRTIASVFPNVTLAQVQALNPSATLSNAADWYVIQNLVNTAANHTTIVVDGHFFIDLPIVISRSYLIISGKNVWSTLQNGVINQIGINQSVIKLNGTGDIQFRNLTINGIQNSNGTKNLHGFEVTITSSNLYFDRVEVYRNGGSGFAVTGGHFLSSKFVDCKFYYNYDNGIYLVHSAGSQKNDIIFEHVVSGVNGYTYSSGSYTQSALTDRGHGFSVSGTAISILGGDSSGNSGAGVYINNGTCNGVTVNNKYFEGNMLADIYVTAGYKQNLNLNGNYPGSTSPSKGKIYFEDGNAVLSDVRNMNYPIATYTHTANKEVYVTTVDTTSDTFTSVAHGLTNGTQIWPIVNKNNINVYPVNVYPGGLARANYAGYYVVNATTDTFQISLSSGGAAVDLTTNANMDLSKWHFETKVLGSSITLPFYLQKYKIIYKGRSLYNGGCYILPYGETTDFLNSTNNNFTDDKLSLNGDVYNYAEISIDGSSYVVKKVKGITTTSSTATANVVTSVDKVLVSNRYNNVQFNSVGLDDWVFANGSTVEVYLGN